MLTESVLLDEASGRRVVLDAESYDAWKPQNRDVIEAFFHGLAADELSIGQGVAAFLRDVIAVGGAPQDWLTVLPASPDPHL